ncbi:hypothetical protein HDV05_000166 [Chytridiales sp. JEL 0842]|nr:hypothetical protein HDV05_000166 [Chytridiales sp. JEL 0842]
MPFKNPLHRALLLAIWVSTGTTFFITLILLIKFSSNTFDHTDTDSDRTFPYLKERACPKWVSYNTILADYPSTCKTLNKAYPSLGFHDRFQVDLCQSDLTCGEGYFRITRKDQKSCRRSFAQNLSLDTEVDEMIKRDIGPDAFWLNFDGPERHAPTDSRHLGNCTYKLPFHLSTTGMFNVTLVHTYDNFTANTEIEFFKSYEPSQKSDTILKGYMLDVCSDLQCKTWTYKELTKYMELPYCKKDQTLQGAFLRIPDPPLSTAKEEWQLKSYGHPYIFHPLGCRLRHTFFQNDTSSCYGSNKTILVMGDSQMRGPFDVAKLRLDGEGKVYDKQNYGAKRNESLYPPPLLLNTTTTRTTAKTGLRLRFQWDPFLKLLSNYAIGDIPAQFNNITNTWSLDRTLHDVDVVFFNTAHWPIAQLRHGGYWPFGRYRTYVEHIFRTLQQISIQQLYYQKQRGGKLTRFIWVGSVSAGNLQFSKGTVDHRTAYKLKMWSDAVKAMAPRFGVEYIDGNRLTAAWVKEAPDGYHFHRTPGIEAIVDLMLHSADVCNDLP